jgi:ADP-heptose:LPS heptosyltransferase
MRALREAFPQTFILTAAARGLSELLKDFQLADEVVDLGIIKPADPGYGSALKRLIRLLRTTNREGFDWVIDFTPRLETQIVSKLGWRTRHITPARIQNLLDVFLKRKALPVDDHAEDCAVALKKIGIQAIPRRFSFALSAEASQRFEALLHRHGSRGAEPIVVLYSSQAGDAHEWGIEKFSEIAHRLANNFQARIVVMDEPHTNEFTRAMKALLPKGAISIAAPRVADYLAPLARASLLITDERGIAKTAGDLDVPVIELAASASPFGDQESYRVLRSSSLHRISTDAVYELAGELIQEGRTPSLFRR